MKINITSILLLFLTISYAQKDEIHIYDINNNKSIVIGSLNSIDNGMYNKLKIRDKKNYYSKSLSNISKLVIENKIYIIRKLNNDLYAFEEIIKGKLSLYKSRKEYFIESEEYGFKKLPFKIKDGLELKKFNYGEVSVYMNKCKEAQNYLLKNSSSLTISKLKETINQYNSCALSNEIQVADKAIEEANKPKEKIAFSIGIGYQQLNSSFENFNSNGELDFSFPTIGFNAYFKPSQKYRIGLSAEFPLKKPDFKYLVGNDVFIQNKTIFSSILFQADYLITTSSNIKPYFGIKGGFYFNSNSSLYVNTSGDNSQSFDATNLFTYSIHIGTEFNLLNQKFDLNIAYLPKVDFDLVANSGIPNNFQETSYSVKGFNFKLSYVF